MFCILAIGRRGNNHTSNMKNVDFKLQQSVDKYEFFYLVLLTDGLYFLPVIVILYGLETIPVPPQSWPNKYDFVIWPIIKTALTVLPSTMLSKCCSHLFLYTESFICCFPFA